MARPLLALAGAGIGFMIGGPRGAQIGYMVGSAVGSYLFPTELQGPRLGETPVQTSREGVPIPIGWGTVHVIGNIIQTVPYVDVTSTERQGKGGGTTIETTRRFQTFAIGMARGRVGPIVGVLRIWEYDKLVYDVRASPAIDAAETAKFAEGIRIYLGDEEQLPDPDLEADTGVGLCPSYRGLPYTVFVLKDTTDSGGAIAQYRFELNTGGGESARLIGEADGGSGDLIAHFDFQQGDDTTITPIASDYISPLSNARLVWVGDGTAVSTDNFVAPLRPNMAQALRIDADHPRVPVHAENYTEFSHGSAGQNIAHYFNGAGFTGAVTMIWTAKHQTLGASETLSAHFHMRLNYGGQAFSTYYYHNEGYSIDVRGNLAGEIATIALGGGDGVPHVYAMRFDAVAHTVDTWVDGGSKQTDNTLATSTKLQTTAQNLIFGSRNQWATDNSPDMSTDLWVGWSKNIPDATIEAIMAAKVAELAGAPPTVGGVTNDICGYVNVDDTNTAAIDDIDMRGFLVAGMYSAADALRALQRPFFWDFPEVDGELLAVLRGGAIVASITHDDIVIGEDVQIETAREQGLEFPRKLHLAYQSAETDYTPTKATSERLSPDILVRGEITVEAPINFEADEAAQRADMMHKVAYAELEGNVKFGIDESWIKLVPADPISIEIRDSVTKRIRITQSDLVDGVLRIEGSIDRISAYSSAVTAPSTLPPTAPPPTIPGLTTWEYMGLPALITAHDTLHYYVAGYGANPAWHGAQLQREIAGEFQNEAQIIQAEVMGELEEALPLASAEYTDYLNTVLVSTNADLESVTEDQILKGANAALIGNEIVQYRTVAAEGDDWRLSVWQRGRLNTTPALHAIGTRFVFLGRPVKVPTDVPLLDTTLRLRAPSFGELPSTGVEANYSFTGRSQTEWAPVSLVANQDGNDWVFSWTPRARLGSSDNPITSTHFIGWRFKFTVGGTTGIYDIDDPNMTNPNYTYTEAQQIVDFGSAQGTLDVELFGLNDFTGEGDALSETV